jgi:guanosine-diphosphatase
MLGALLINDRNRSTEDAVTNLSDSAKTTATTTTTSSRTRPLSSRVSSNSTTYSKSNPHSFSQPRTKPTPTPKSKPKITVTSKAMAILSRSPTANNYERLEGGMMGPLGPHLKWKWTWTWRKFAIAAVVLIGLVWFASPRARVAGHAGEQWGLPVKGGDYR